jgi:hypothetical protein
MVSSVPQMVPVYIRKGDVGTDRVITFRIDKHFASLDLIERGFAIDGYQAMRVVPMADLYDAQVAILELFGARGLTPEFV